MKYEIKVINFYGEKAVLNSDLKNEESALNELAKKFLDCIFGNENLIFNNAINFMQIDFQEVSKNKFADAFDKLDDYPYCIYDILQAIKGSEKWYCLELRISRTMTEFYKRIKDKINAEQEVLKDIACFFFKKFLL